MTFGGCTITPLCRGEDYKFIYIKDTKVYNPQPKLTYLEKKRSPELCCESSSSKAKISSEKKLLDDNDKLRETVKILANKFTSIQESKRYKPEPLLNSLELKWSPELCCELSSSKAKISSVVEKKLLDAELFHEKLRKAFRLQVWNMRHLCPDDYNIEEPKLPNLYYKPKLTSTERKRARRFCEICSIMHSPWDMSALESCSVCHCVRHLSSNCPLLVKFTVVCCCGCPFFDIDEWVCRSKRCVFKKAMLKEKVCELCEAVHDHTTYECPEAKDIAAKYKMLDERVHEVEASKRCKRA